MSCRVVPCVGAALAMLLALVGQARSEALDADMEWLRIRHLPGTESCFMEPQLAESIQRQLRRSPVEVARKSGYRLIATIDARPESRPVWKATVELADSNGKVLGTRDIEEHWASCGALQESLGVIGALLLDPPPAPVTPRKWEYVLAGAAAVGTGLLPRTSWGAGVSVFRLSAPGVGLYGSAEGWPQQSIQLADGKGIGVALLRLAAGGCLVTASSLRRPMVGACLGAAVGWLLADGNRFRTVSPARDWTAHLEGRVWVHQPLFSGFLLLAGGRLELPAIRYAIGYRESDGEVYKVFRMAQVSAVGELGVGYRFH